MTSEDTVTNLPDFSPADIKEIQGLFHQLIIKRAAEFGGTYAFLNDKNKGLPDILDAYQRGIWYPLYPVDGMGKPDILESRVGRAYYPVDGMGGGFAYVLTKRHGEPLLIVDSWCRVIGGSEQRHEITTGGIVKTYEDVSDEVCLSDISDVIKLHAWYFSSCTRYTRWGQLRRKYKEYKDHKLVVFLSNLSKFIVFFILLTVVVILISIARLCG
jgi:hypothetical protein